MVSVKHCKGEHSLIGEILRRYVPKVGGRHCSCSRGLLGQRQLDRTPLHEAILGGSVEIVKLLLENNASPNMPNKVRDNSTAQIPGLSVMHHVRPQQFSTPAAL